MPLGSRSFPWISQDSLAFLRIPWDSLGFPMTPPGSPRIPQESAGFPRIPWDTFEFRGYLRPRCRKKVPRTAPGDARTTQLHPRTPANHPWRRQAAPEAPLGTAMDPKGPPNDTKGHQKDPQGTPKDPQGGPKTPQRTPKGPPRTPQETPKDPQKALPDRCPLYLAGPCESTVNSSQNASRHESARPPWSVDPDQTPSPIPTPPGIDSVSPYKRNACNVQRLYAALPVIRRLSAERPSRPNPSSKLPPLCIDSVSP